MGGGKVNDEAFFARVFAGGYAYWADTECGEGGEVNGPIMNPCRTSLSIKVSTVSGSVRADWRLLQMWEVVGSVTKPGENPKLRPSMKKRTKSGSGWDTSSAARAGIFRGVAK